MGEFRDISNLTVSRVEPTDFAKYGFDEYHYKGDVSKSCTCFLFHADGEVCGFVSMLSHTSKGLTNAWRFSRIVVMPAYREMGLGIIMELFLASIYTSVGKAIYNCCSSKSMGKYHQKHPDLWHQSSGNRRERHNNPDERYNHRVEYKCYRHRYDGSPLDFKGLEAFLSPMDVMRAKGLLYKRYKIDVIEVLRLLYRFNDDVYIRDYLALPFDLMQEKYSNKYKWFYHSELGETDEDTPYVMLPRDYIEIRRYKNKAVNKELAKRRLYINGLLRRMIMPSITFEHMLQSLLNETLQYIEDGLITKKELLELTRRVMMSDAKI